MESILKGEFCLLIFEFSLLLPSLLLLLSRSISHFWGRLSRKWRYFWKDGLGQDFCGLGLLLVFCLRGSKRTNPFIIINILSEFDRSIKILYNTATKLFIK